MEEEGGEGGGGEGVGGWTDTLSNPEAGSHSLIALIDNDFPTALKYNVKH